MALPSGNWVEYRQVRKKDSKKSKEANIATLQHGEINTRSNSGTRNDGPAQVSPKSY